MKEQPRSDTRCA